MADTKTADETDGAPALVTDLVRISRPSVGNRKLTLAALIALNRPAINTISGTSHNMVAADAETYMRFTNASAKTLTVQPNSTAALATASEYHGRNVGAADLTIVEGSGVTVNEPAGGSLVIPQGGTFTLKRVATDEFDLIGVTA